MNSNELGRLFEIAASEVLTKLFECWGYEVLDRKIQKSGTQHGFDSHYKITRNQTTLSVFVECKASESLNTISARLLTEKIAQLDWAGFPDKDVHLFFSPSRAIDFDNNQLTIEDDSQPFVIVDWMRRDGQASPVQELFAAYRDVATDPVVKDYCDFLFSEVAPDFKTSRRFAEVCGDLKRDFDRRIAEHSARAREKDFQIINGAFWGQAQNETHFEFLHYYYTKTDSTPARLREVVANDYYVRNEKLDKAFERTLNQAVKDRSALIKILSKGGEGKSSFLWHIAKTYHGSHRIVWLEDVDSDLPAQIEKQIRRLDADSPILLLLDNAAVYGRSLTEFAQKLVTVFRRHNIVLILAEREFRYLNIEDVQDFEAVFNQTHCIAYKATGIREAIVDRLLVHLQSGNPFTGEIRAAARDAFLDDRRKSLAECTFSVIKYLHSRDELRGYRFDWEDWESFAAQHAPKLQRLYLVVATFYQFGYSLDIEFCAGFLKDADVVDINSALRESANVPIYRRGRHLLLRHETLASWYLDDETENLRVNRRNSEEVFKKFLDKIETDFARNVFIWACIKNRDFRKSYLAKFVDDSKRVLVLEDIIKQHPAELKCRTELSKIYQHQKRWLEAEDILLELKRLDPENLQARTELSKIYQQQKRWDEAIRLLKEYIELDPEGLHPRTELSKIYQQQKRWREAEDILLESLKIDAEQLHPRTELSKIYQQQKRWREAEDILLECLRISQDDLNSRTELSKIYQQQKRWREAEDILLELKRLDPENLQARTELSKIYQQQKRWREAEDILLECLRISQDDLNSRTELSKIYQQQGKVLEADALLRECLEIDPYDANSLLELGKMCSKDSQTIIEAEQFFQRILQVEPDNVYAKIELAALYRDMKRYGDRERLLFEIYDAHPDDLPTLKALALVFRRFRKYRIALALLEYALDLRKDNLLIIIEIIRIYEILCNRQQARLYIVRGEEILREDTHNKHRERFGQLGVSFDEAVNLRSLDEVGVATMENGQRYVENDSGRYLVNEHATVNNQIDPNDKVFFGLYSKGQEVYADFIEPYFENIDDLASLK